MKRIVLTTLSLLIASGLGAAAQESQPQLSNELEKVDAQTATDFLEKQRSHVVNMSGRQPGASIIE
jgi:hypothetical protein